MIQVVLKQHNDGAAAGKWDIYVYDRSTEGDLLVFSNQGYENREDAEQIVERLFATIDLGRGRAEEVDMFVSPQRGGGLHRMIR